MDLGRLLQTDFSLGSKKAREKDPTEAKCFVNFFSARSSDPIVPFFTDSIHRHTLIVV
jgi:hypothetical protein